MMDKELLSLFSLISLIESNYNQYAIRFERKLFEKMKHSVVSDVTISRTITANKQYSEDTVLMTMSCSFGMPQILGYNLFDIARKKMSFGIYKLSDIYGVYLQDVRLQLLAFQHFIDTRISMSPGEILKYIYNRNLDEINNFAVRYNGSIHYREKILKITSQISEKRLFNELIERFPILIET